MQKKICGTENFTVISFSVKRSVKNINFKTETKSLLTEPQHSIKPSWFNFLNWLSLKLELYSESTIKAHTTMHYTLCTFSSNTLSLKYRRFLLLITEKTPWKYRIMHFIVASSATTSQIISNYDSWKIVILTC